MNKRTRPVFCSVRLVLLTTGITCYLDEHLMKFFQHTFSSEFETVLTASKIFRRNFNTTTNSNAAHFVYLVLNYASKNSSGESLDDVKEFLPKICKQCLKSLQENLVNSLFVFQKFWNVSKKIEYDG